LSPRSDFSKITASQKWWLDKLCIYTRYKKRYLKVIEWWRGFDGG
jgi:hypothetical protein